MPLYRRLPKRGFNSLIKNKLAKINLEKIQILIEKNLIKNTEKINIELLKKVNAINKNSNKLKILGIGNLKQKIDANVDFISLSAKQKIEKSGGVITIKKSK